MSRRKLGQHFLIKGRILERIARAACGDRTPLVVEIGPGRGALTGHLLAHSDLVAAIEIDPQLAAYLRERHLQESRLTIVEADALTVDWSRWGAGVLAGNLPYYAATPIVEKYLRAPGVLGQAVFLVQKEVADRIAAKPGHGSAHHYGYFSVLCQFFASVEYLFTVPPGAFHPPPKVDSAVIRLTPHAEFAAPDPDRFLAFVSACFRQKRKTLRNNVTGIPAEYASKRAEQLTLAEFVELYRALTSSQATL